MKRIIALLLTALMLFSLTACGATGSIPASEKNDDKSKVEAKVPEREYDESDPAAVLNEITDDFKATITYLTEQQTEMFSKVGTTYEDYEENKGLIDKWLELVISESDALFVRTRDNSIAYFKLIAEHPNHKYSEFCDEALGEFYDSVYDDAMGEYYDNMYDDAMGDLYDEYYDGIVSDAYDELEYDVWSDASSAAYKVWSDASNSLYKEWLNESYYLYGLWGAVNSAFCWNDNFDVDAIVAKYEAEEAIENEKEAEEEAKVYTDLEVIYEINSDGDAEVTGFKGEGNRVTINSEYEGKNVVSIADNAFENCSSLEKIIMWADVEAIGDAAFKGCTGLTEFSIPSETEIIGNHAFEGCANLENLIIWGDPDIGEYAFSGCTALTEISIGSDTENVGAHAFEGCTGVTSLIIWGAEIIGDYAFAGCTAIDDVSIPSEVRSIGNHAFDGCSALESAIVWGDDTAIGADAFASCPKLEEIPASRGTVLKCTNVTDTDKTETKPVETKPAETDPTETDAATISEGMRPDFKEAMDSYEAFYVEYCEFMKEYKDNPTDLTLLTKYGDMLVKAEEMNEAFEAWDEDDLNSEELKYYLDVNNRVMKMLVDIIG